MAGTDVRQLARDIRLLALDVDGVLTDGRLFFTNDGQEMKAFNTLDGHGIKMLQQSGVLVAIITGRTSKLVEKRAADLGIRHLTQGREDKLVALQELCELTGLSLDQCAYMGDDLPDLPAIRACRLGMSVPGACPTVREHAHWISDCPGGLGAVREACELIMQAQGTFDGIVQPYLK